MPADSSWKMPVVSPDARSSKVFASSSGIASRSMVMPRCSCTKSTAWRRIVRFESPRKSNLSRPIASMACISYWVISASELVAFWRGMSSVSGSRLMTTPAAWVLAFRATPSRCRAKSVMRLIAGSASTCSRSAGAVRMASSSVIPSWFGTAFAMRSTSPYEWPSTRPTSRIAARASIVPKVMICATWSWPYLRPT